MDLSSLKNIVREIYRTRRAMNLPYHNWFHTRFVFKSALKIMQLTKISVKEEEILVAAIFIHDIGNLISRENHEEVSIEYVKPILILCGATEEEIKLIESLVLSTKFPQKPKTKLQKIICDADLSLMGYDIWDRDIQGYREELGIKDMKKWYQMQLSLLSSHTWWTKEAHQLFEEEKQANLRLVEEKLKEKS